MYINSFFNTDYLFCFYFGVFDNSEGLMEFSVLFDLGITYAQMFLLKLLKRNRNQ